VSDPVNRPDHYTEGGIEAIEVIEAKGHGSGFCYGNALKYLMRAPYKGAELEDLRKARWYVERLIVKTEQLRSDDPPPR
jgi:hypothetical protein